MKKPASMKLFDLLYLGSLAVGMIGLFLGWDTMIAQMNAELASEGVALDEAFASNAIVGSFLFGVAISVGLWFLVSVLRIEFVKWIILLFTAYGVVTLATGIARDGFDMIELSGIVSTLMSIAALVMLFRPDSKAWFDAKHAGRLREDRDDDIDRK